MNENIIISKSNGEDFSKFKESLTDMINHYINHTTALSRDDILHAMGFPPNWLDV